MFLHVQITAHACCFISALAVVVFTPAGKTQSQCGVVTVSSRVDYCCNYQLELVQLHRGFIHCSVLKLPVLIFFTALKESSFETECEKC